MAGGALTSEWIAAFTAVPRSEFLPDLMWPFDMASGHSVPVSRSDAPERWHDYADSDVPIVTQWDDGQHTGREPGTLSTSSASMPSMVFAMLRDLSVRHGHQVLEIGTGTGWNAALLAHRVGADNVTTVEIDPAVAQDANRALQRCGLPVTAITGDGTLGYPDRAPYDRVIATAGLRAQVPWAWVEQTQPGGIIITPWGTDFGNGDAIARLVVAEDGLTASGRFTGPAEFMKFRAQRVAPIEHDKYVPDGVAEGDQSATALTEGEFLGDRFDARRFAYGLRIPHCTMVVAGKRDGVRPVWLYSRTDHSWACVMFRDGDTAPVWQRGDRRLWDEAHAAYDWWADNGRPDHTRFGLTVTPEGESVWLDSPAGAWRI
ncbi:MULTISPECIES: methyltransferase domain-containing protein [unclassified Streptomyces]|uniref:methyltransferase domain-containing protein n=1 Tax=unclassified Streptomyces TaxID=2593676 RepID=UPI0033E38626